MASSQTPLRVAITNVTLGNGGDAAILYGVERALRVHPIELDHQLDAAAHRQLRRRDARVVGQDLVQLLHGLLVLDRREEEHAKHDEDAARPEQAEPLVDAVVARLQELGLTTATGVFGADMQVELVNDGPVTVLVERDAT